MALGVRQQGEIAYLRAALGVDELEARIAQLEGKEEYEGLTLEARHSHGLANLAKLDSYGASEFSPEGAPDPEVEEEYEQPGVVNQDETVQEAHPAVQATPELDAALAENEEEEK